METGQFARSIPALRAGYSSDDLVNTKNRSGPASDGIASPDEASSPNRGASPALFSRTYKEEFSFTHWESIK
jgi:hypothetical protein